MLGGLSSAGKTTTLRAHAGLDLDQYVLLNPDDMKEELLKRGAHPTIPGHEDLAPMEHSTLIHAESCHLAEMLAARAYADGKNVIWDVTMGELGGTRQRLTQIRQRGYKVRGIFVDVPIATSIERSSSRYQKALIEYLEGKGHGGRPIPPQFISEQGLPDGGSRNRQVFDTVRDQFEDWQLFDTSGLAPRLIDSKHTDTAVDDQVIRPGGDQVIPPALPGGDATWSSSWAGARQRLSAWWAGSLSRS